MKEVKSLSSITLDKLKKMKGYRGSDLERLVELTHINGRYIAFAGSDEPPYFEIVTADLYGFGDEQYFKTIKDAIEWELGYL